MVLIKQRVNKVQFSVKDVSLTNGTDYKWVSMRKNISKKKNSLLPPSYGYPDFVETKTLPLVTTRC